MLKRIGTLQKTNRKDTISLMAVGDIMLGRKVGQCIISEGPGWVFERVRDYLTEADLVIGNLEAPITNADDAFLENAKVPLKAPKVAAKALAMANFKVMNLGNNHILDYGEEGLQDTLSCLRDYQIRYVGAGENLDEARRPLRLNVKGLKVSFFSYCSSYNAQLNAPGTAPFDVNRIHKDLLHAKKESHIVIVSLHHGVEYADYPTHGFIKLAHQVIDAGAKVVLGHHPHVLQGIEKYNQGIIAYSLGNFVFDLADKTIRKNAYRDCLLAKKYGMHFEMNDNRPSQSMILEILLGRLGIQEYKIHPVLIGDDFRPHFLLSEEGVELLKRIEELSRNIGNNKLLINQILKRVEADSIKIYLGDKGFTYYLRHLVRLRPRHIIMIFDMLKAKLPT